MTQMLEYIPVREALKLRSVHLRPLVHILTASCAPHFHLPVTHPSDIVQGVAVSTTAFMLPRFFAQKDAVTSTLLRTFLLTPKICLQGTNRLASSEIDGWHIVARVSGGSTLVCCGLISKRPLPAIPHALDLIIV
jgi:hypothetical protein